MLNKENTMNIQLYEFEKDFFKKKDDSEKMLSDKEINEKYELGEARIVTEQGAIKLPLVPGIFEGDKYNRKPIYQRRITWDTKKRSRLIESFIMNIPVPPIFMYEIEFGKYEVMDGLQRISAIIDFYNDVYALDGLTEWSELNGKKYSELPQKVKEGIDRRQISMVSLLKESAKTASQEQKMKRMVFERLNTGGVRLEEQEIRNALYDGEFNTMCKKLAEINEFRTLWGIPKNVKAESIINELEELDAVDSLDVTEQLASNNLYMRMYDVELVLRFFAMRHIDEYSGQLCEFFDTCLISGNKIINSDSARKELFEKLFRDTICKAEKIFGEYAFCQYKAYRDKYKWSKPQKMVYDALMLALSECEINYDIEYDCEKNIKYMEKFYIENAEAFNGKKQSKNEILERKKLFEQALKDIIEG